MSSGSCPDDVLFDHRQFVPKLMLRYEPKRSEDLRLEMCDITHGREVGRTETSAASISSARFLTVHEKARLRGPHLPLQSR